MSGEVVRESNPGPLKLEYDITPRDVRNMQAPSSQMDDSNFRFKGFPERNFEDSRHPIFGTNPDPMVLEGVKISEIQGQEHRAKPHYFDTRNPKAYGNPKGLQYGSETMPDTDTHPKPIRGALREMDRSNDPIGTSFGSYLATGHFQRKRFVTSAELSKFRQRQEEGAAEIRKLKHERLQSMMNAEAEKKYDMEMLKNYNPWGKPGAGAPLGVAGNKKLKFTEYDTERIKPSPHPDRDLEEEYGDNNSWFGKPGAGAPLRTESGKVKTELKGAADIRFQDTQKGRQVYDVEVRYKQDPKQRYNYSKDLERQIASKKLVAQEERIKELKQELNMMSNDPFGKPGAGAPNKTMSGSEQQTNKSTTLTNDLCEMRRSEKREADRRAHLKAQNDNEFTYDPWGKGVGQPRYDNNGDAARHLNAKRYEGVFTENPRSPPREEGNTISLTQRGGGGAPIYNDRAEFGKQTRLPILMKRDEKGDTTFREDLPGLRRRPPPPSQDDDELKIYDPFGKGGAGAPVKDQRGNVITSVFGNFNRNSPKETERRNRDPNYIYELQADSERFKAQRDQQDRSLKYGAGDLATEIKKGQVGFPRRDPYGKIANHHLHTTDVTREKASVIPVKNDKTNEYHRELQYAEQQRHREEKLEKLRERQEARHHGDSQNLFWGRPGGGAPNDVHKKANLDQILYSPRRDEGGETRHSVSEPAQGGHKDWYQKPGAKPVDFYSKTYAPDAQPNGNFVRTTVGSNHTNNFEVPVNDSSRRARGQDYHLPKPYATEGTEVI